MDPEQRNERLLDRTFRFSIILKAIDGALELVGGLLLLVVPVRALNNAVVALTRGELSEDPKDFLARHLVRAGQDLQDTRAFGGIYLISHGAAKVVLVVALLRGHRWAYPALFWFLVAFIAYQGYRMAYAPSFGLGLLTAFDAFVAWLVWLEARQHGVFGT